MNYTTSPTRLGFNQEADTNPDLTWIRGLLIAALGNNEETLGSDYNIIQISVPLTRSSKRNR
ncbi:hypothetical protein HPB48_020091 [Haemaphysalis longicornis]|uniref:Uncharacterized protein n=1 Tax=Haemaphysalis longicornis TaxID=44386 RepID=A0A9J6GM46_HAELO|nr:hypothetical protein HPB48_020091 [Haemaphysalis longicornis]